MPELPDITAYLSALEQRILGRVLLRVRVTSPFLLRTVAPPITSANERSVVELRRVGKRVAIRVEGDIWLVLHLMVAGRLHWREAGVRASGKQNLAAFEFSEGTLVLTESGTKKRASLHVVRGEEALHALDRGGIEVMGSTLEAFAAALTRENHTVKRALTDPRLFSGIGNAYSDEILHDAKISPVKLTAKLSPEEIGRLHRAASDTLAKWVELLRAQAGRSFPEGVTAFRPEMAVHGKFGKPCPACGAAVQRIRYAENETNYCPNCQSGGRLLADRSLSRLLKEDWPRTAEELEELPRLYPNQK